MPGFGMSDVKPSGCATRELANDHFFPYQLFCLPVRGTDSKEFIVT